MNVSLITAPTTEPITLSEAKQHCRLDSETLDGNLTITQSLAYGSHIVADNYTTHVGAGVDVLGKRAEVLLHCGTNGATGTNDTVIQESDSLSTGYLTWSGGTFTQVTTSNDNADYKKQYTGTKRYIRTASKVLLAACEFGTSVLVESAEVAEDDLLTVLITAAREIVESHTRRKLLTQTWEYYLNAFPSANFFKIPFGNLQSITSIKYKDEDGTETALTSGTDFILETNDERCGRIVLPSGVSWPSGDLYPSKPITVKFVCGWTSAAAIPARLTTAAKMILMDLYENRETQMLTNLAQTYSPNKTMKILLDNFILREEF